MVRRCPCIWGRGKVVVGYLVRRVLPPHAMRLGGFYSLVRELRKQLMCIDFVQTVSQYHGHCDLMC